MSNGVDDLQDWVFGLPGEERFTQDSPVLPEVWFRFAEKPEEPQDLLLTPHQDCSAAGLITALRERGIGEDLERSEGEGGVGLAYNEGYVVVRLTLGQLVRDVVPLSKWWVELSAASRFGEDWLVWYAALVGRVEAGPGTPTDQEESRGERLLRFASQGVKVLNGREWAEPGGEERAEPGGEEEADRPPAPTPLWTVSVNREARTALSRSRLVVKADAAERVFAIGCSEIRWAIADTGIDATHPAFRLRDEQGRLVELPATGPEGASRVVATYDFTKLRAILSGEQGDLPKKAGAEIRRRIEIGRAIDWDAVEPLLRVPHDTHYPPPRRDHGTHVAGIVGSDWRTTDDDEEEMPAEENLIGICPDIRLYDLRVFPDAGPGDEFAILAALQFVRHLNSHSDLQVIHGINLSLSIDHDVRNYAVGRTPVCDECERLTASGVVVSVAAGNEGQATYKGEGGKEHDGFRTVAITDPGNAEEVITVGSTHRQNPHTYGVSYFSSRGPTGDGRAKPDLVAPGEKIKSPVPDHGYQVKDGTSQATAHVSGVAAMLIARNPELIGQPRQVKQILCGTATDLGREPTFQGAGLIDALRALQEV
ncbi:MAG TPA: S8 family peptidase [Solirubrobacterales bacterium]|nr:S8 family peptidase [Solirubrobacterales bacterium]